MVPQHLIVLDRSNWSKRANLIQYNDFAGDPLLREVDPSFSNIIKFVFSVLIESPTLLSTAAFIKA